MARRRCRPTLLERLLAALPDLDVFQGYGMTENCGLLTVLGPTEHREGGDLLKSAGRTVPGNVVTIQDADGTILPDRRGRARCAPRAATSCGSTGTVLTRPRQRSPAVGTTPATPAGSTKPDTSTSSTGSRT